MSSSSPLRVGIVGASARGSWAQYAHVPALQAAEVTPLAKLSALSTSSQQSAQASGEAFGVDPSHCFASAEVLAASPQVDLITVSVNVAKHLEPVESALRAGKPCYCEWPLGKDLSEAQRMASAAAEAETKSGGRVRHFIGTQARHAPAFQKMKEMLASGVIGRPMTARVLSTIVEKALTALDSNSYVQQPGSGASVLIIPGGHTLDAVLSVLGGIESFQAQSSIVNPTGQFQDTKRVFDRVLPDHWLLQAKMASGVALSFELDATRRAAEGDFFFQVRGEKGNLTIETHNSMGGVQTDEHTLRLELFGEDGQVKETKEVVGPQAAPARGPAANVAALYQAVARDLQRGEKSVPDFAHAVRLHQLLTDIEQAATSGQRLHNQGKWPIQ